MSLARFRMKSFASPSAEMPDRSPLISAANTGTPARAKPSARTCSETVLPVPVAPVTSPCRFASASVRKAVAVPPCRRRSLPCCQLFAMVTPSASKDRSLVMSIYRNLSRTRDVRSAAATIDAARMGRARATSTDDDWRISSISHLCPMSIAGFRHDSCIVATLAGHDAQKPGSR